MIADHLSSAVLLAGPGQPLDWDRPAPDLGVLLGLVGSEQVQEMPRQNRPQTPDLRPVAYSAILRSLLGCLDRTRVYRLYQEIFNEDHSDCLDQQTVEVDFLQRVHSELFEFDLMAMLQLTWEDEAALSYSIPVTGYRIPWETGYLSDFPPCLQLLATCIYLHQMDDHWSSIDIGPGYFGDIEIPHLDWLVANVGGALDPTWQQRIEPQLERLDNLPGPFNALGDLIAGALSMAENIFLWSVPAEFRQEYDNGAELFWVPSHIQWLADQYREALPAIARIRTFEAWFEGHDEDWANQAIVAALTGEDLTPFLSTATEVSALEVEPEVEVEP